ncbi:CD320 antigen [Oryctolagus cuniculus]|uniref:CD320 antigen n=1 Tax=Oryctolagus cuniculus TaxID=9986 RepID=UPI003877A163
MARGTAGRTATLGLAVGLALLLLLGLDLGLEAAPTPLPPRLWAQAPGSSTGSCPPSSFQCRASGYCVPLTWRCDGDPDCSDGSDEEECRIEPCTQNGQCPPPLGLPCSCDNISDCPGGGHQGLHNCSRQPCPAGEIRCSLGDACIPHTWRCDGHRDCPDSSDELGCEINETLQDRNATTAGTPVTPTTVTPLRNATAASVGYQAANPSAYGLAAAAVVLSASLAAAALVMLSRLRAQGHVPPPGLLAAVKESLLLSRRKTSLL